MTVYRITLSTWADALMGSGIPARWNSKGVKVIYTTGSRALACLENLVHRSGEGLNRNFSLIEVTIPDKCKIQRIELSSLPNRWYRNENYHLCQRIGDDWIENRDSPVLQIPSSIIPEEFNFLINPQHPDFSDISIKKIIPFQFDERLS